MNNNSRRGGQVQQYLENMLALIQEISKKTENFDELRSLLPLVGQLKKAQLECKQIAEVLKQTTDNLPKMKSKILSANRGGDSLLDIYDRMIGHLQVELNKLHSGLENISSQSIGMEKVQEENIKNSSSVLIKQIEDLLVSNRKVINDQITSKRKEYLGQGQKDKYLKMLLKNEMIKKDELKKMVLKSKYQFGQFRCLFNAYEDIQNKKQFGVVKQPQQIEQTLIRKNELQKRRRFVIQSQQHIEKQYPFVLKNLQLLQSVQKKGRYQQKLFYHYHSWAKRITVTLQTIIIKISSYDSQRTNIKQQQKFLQLCREKIVKYDSMLKDLSRFI